jgi:hypothetical protein
MLNPNTVISTNSPGNTGDDIVNSTVVYVPVLGAVPRLAALAVQSAHVPKLVVAPVKGKHEPPPTDG